MPIASGVLKRVSIKKETTFAVPPGASGAQELRRVASTLSVRRPMFRSSEISSTFQDSDVRFGSKLVDGDLSGELSPATFKTLFEAALRAAFAAGPNITGLTLSSSAAGKTFTRSAGSWLTDGVKIGDVVRPGSHNAGTNGKNYRVTALTATVMTVASLAGADPAVVDTTNVAGASMTVAGKKLSIPASGHTDDSFAIEHYFADLDESELFTGLKVSQIEINIRPGGMATAVFRLIGSDMVAYSGASAPYFTNPTAPTVTAILAGPVGQIRWGSADSALVTSASIIIDCNMTPAAVVGSNATPAIFPGRARVSGRISAYFDSIALRDAAIAESTVNLNIKLDADNSQSGDFMVFDMPRVKLSPPSKGDGEQGIEQSFDFVALYNSAGGTGLSTLNTTISIQDSAA